MCDTGSRIKHYRQVKVELILGTSEPLSIPFLLHAHELAHDLLLFTFNSGKKNIPILVQDIFGFMVE